MAKERKSLNFSTIILLIITSFSVVISVVLGTVLTVQSVRQMKDMVESKTIELASAAASLLDGDSLKGMTADDVGSEAYQECFDTLAAFKSNNEGTSGELAYIYCCRWKGGEEFEFTIDPTEEPAEFGEYLEWTKALESAAHGTAAFDAEPYTDRWGTFYSAYAPVFDSKHKEVVMIVGIDVWADWYTSTIWSNARSTIIISAVAMISGITVGLLINAGIRKRFKVISQEFNELENDIQQLITDIQEPIDNPTKIEPIKEGRDQSLQLRQQISVAKTEIKNYIIYTKKQAYVDGLSRVGNRSAYVMVINQIDLDSPFAVIVYDVNVLKYINDTYGHDTGDRVITIIGSILKSVFDEDCIFRIGGDEFVVILTNAYKDTVEELYKTANTAIEEATNKEKLPFELSVSKGIAYYDNEKDKSYRDVFKRADKNMYEDKKLFHKKHPKFEDYK